MSVLVVVEHDRGILAEASLEAFAFARSIAEQLGEPVDALLIGADAAGLAAVCAAHGANAVHHASIAGDSVGDYGPEAYGMVVASLAALLSPSGIVASGTDRGNEVLAQAGNRALLCWIDAHQLDQCQVSKGDIALHAFSAGGGEHSVPGVVGAGTLNKWVGQDHFQNPGHVAFGQNTPALVHQVSIQVGLDQEVAEGSAQVTACLSQEPGHDREDQDQGRNRYEYARHADPTDRPCP